MPCVLPLLLHGKVEDTVTKLLVLVDSDAAILAKVKRTSLQPAAASADADGKAAEEPATEPAAKPAAAADDDDEWLIVRVFCCFWE